MTNDYRADAASCYDLGPTPNDVPFYLSTIPSPDASVLDLGCSIGRVLLPMSDASAHIQGVDHSEAMPDVCRSKLNAAQIP